MANSNIRKAQYGRALKALMFKKDLSKISISDLCRYTNTNRHTFYYHFKDIPELIQWLYCDEVDSRMKRYDGVLSKKVAVEYLGILKEDRVFFKRAIDYLGQKRMSTIMMRHETGLFTDMVKRYYDLNELPQETTQEIKYHLRACCEISLDWVRNSNGVTEDELVEKLLSFLPSYVQDAICENERLQSEM